MEGYINYTHDRCLKFDCALTNKLQHKQSQLPQIELVSVLNKADAREIKRNVEFDAK
jgi:hypothetical protein